MNHFAELISMALTVPTLIYSGAVVYLFAKDAFLAIREGGTQCHHWLILGIFVGFVGSVLDNLYWAIPWSLSYIGHPMKDFFHENGVWPNIFSRQILTGTAAYCHIYSTYIDRPESGKILNVHRKRILRRLAVWSFALGLVYVLALVALRYAK